MATESFSEKLLKCALWYAKKGWPVLPLHSIKNGACTCKEKGKCGAAGKHPRYDSEHLQHGVKSATTQEWIIRKWWEKWPNANIGIATGKNSFDVIDIDLREGKDGLESLHEIEAALGIKIPDTVEQITGSGSYQRFFRYAGGALQNAVGFAPGLDIRTDGGLVVVPPSLHLSGNHYEWEASSGPWHVAAAEFPPQLLDYIMRQTMSPESSNGGGVNVAEVLNGLAQGKRDYGLFRYACRLREKNLSHEEAKIILLGIASKCSPPFPESEALKKLDQAWKYEPSNPDEPPLWDDPVSTVSGVSAVSPVKSVSSGKQLVSSGKQTVSKESTNPSVAHTEGITAHLREYVKDSVGCFTVQDVDREFNLKTRLEKTARARALHLLVKEGIVLKDRTIKGKYHILDKSIAWVDIDAPSCSTFPLTMPFGINEMVNIPPRSIIVVAGTTNAGKTSFLLNMALLNLRGDRQQVYLMSEMGVDEYRSRLERFDIGMEAWKPVRAAERSAQFNAVIWHHNSDGITYVDFLEDIGGEYFKLASSIREIYDALGSGVVVVAIQKKIGQTYGRGGESTAEKSRLYLAVDKLTDGRLCQICSLRIVKAKDYCGENPNGKEIHFKLSHGAAMLPLTKWRRWTDKEREYAVNRYIREHG